MNRKVILGVAALLVVGAGVYWFLQFGSDRKDDPNKDDRPDKPDAVVGFREDALEAGITFRMAFLPGEQGAKFKINLYDHGCGVVVGDFDNDGFDDVYFLNQLKPNALYRNRGNDAGGNWLGFEDVTEKAGVGVGDRVCVGAVFADYNNDGYPDLYVTSTRGGNILFRNNKDGTFTDVTKEAGLTLIAHSQTATFFDYDNDGHLDLFVTNTAKWTLNDYDKGGHYFRGPKELFELASSEKEYNVLYRNNGNGTFTDVTGAARLQGQGWGGDVAVFDYNNDGHLDLLVTNMFGASQLYRNNGNRTFSDVTKEVLGKTSWGAIGCKVFDFNNDGRLDILIVDMHSDMWFPPNVDPRTQPAQDFKTKYPHFFGRAYERDPTLRSAEARLAAKLNVDYPNVVFGNTLFKHLPTDKFEEVSDRANLETFWPWGIATGDLDNDGFEDVFLPSGMGYPYDYWPNSLMMNKGDGTFTDRAESAGIEPPQGGVHLKDNIGGQRAARSSRAAATADFTNTGRLDLIVNNFNDHPYFFRNSFPKKNYVEFRLTGARPSNRDALGALVKIHLGKEAKIRLVQAASGYLSQSSRTVHFGLGDCAKIDRVEILWPSGQRQQIEKPAINQRHDIPEPNPQK